MKNENNSNFNEITFLDFWKIILNNIYFILIVSFTFLIIASIYAWFIVSPSYISKADVMVQVQQSSNNSSTTDPNYDLVNAFRLIDTVAELMEKDVVLNNALERLNELGYTELNTDILRDNLRVSSSSSSYFINISFINMDTSLSKNAVDEIINAVIEETDVENAFPVLTDKIRRTSFASDAEYYSPNKIVYSLGGLFLGAFLSVCFVFVKESLSSNFKSKDEIETVLKVQVLGVIPYMNFKEKK